MSAGVTFFVQLLVGLVSKKVDFEVAAKAAAVNAEKITTEEQLLCCQNGHCGTEWLYQWLRRQQRPFVV